MGEQYKFPKVWVRTTVCENSAAIMRRTKDLLCQVMSRSYPLTPDDKHSIESLPQIVCQPCFSLWFLKMTCMLWLKCLSEILCLIFDTP